MCKGPSRAAGADMAGGGAAAGAVAGGHEPPGALKSRGSTGDFPAPFDWDSFDIHGYVRALKGEPLPQGCPVPGCERSYMSLNGLEYHLRHHDGALSASATPSLRSSLNGSFGAGGGRRRSRGPQRAEGPPDPRASHWATPLVAPSARHQVPISALRFVDVELDGVVTQLDVTQRLEVVRAEGPGAASSDGSVGSPGDLPEASVSAASTPGNACSLASSMCAPLVPTPPSEIPREWFEPVQDGLAHDALRLPTAVARVSGRQFPPASGAHAQDVRPAAYYRFTEKSTAEQDAEVEYDMDEEDTEWLAMVNAQRADAGLKAVPKEVFELLMDRLEKESCFLSQSVGRRVGPSADDDAVCCVCRDGESDNTNAIIFCDACNIAVHQDCYGVPYIPEGQWLCRRCIASPSRGVDCVLCPNKGGAFKQTTDGRWAHVACAVWVPETGFANAVYLEPIEGVERIPKARWKLTCYICRRREGACIQCAKTNCYSAFHVTCAQEAGTFMEVRAESNLEYPAKTAFCAEHSPVEDEGRTLMHSDARGGADVSLSASHRKRRKQRVRRARRVVSESPEHLVVSVPMVPAQRIARIVGRLTMERRAQFVQRVQAYWRLKRESRCGVPLIRRLQVTHQRQSLPGGRNAGSGGGGARAGTEDVGENSERQRWQRLRQDLERVRLLVEQVRKREKQKREGVRVAQQLAELCVDPRQPVLRRAVAQLQDLDYRGFFLQPVPIEYVPDYLDVVARPMDLGTMMRMAERGDYAGVDAVAADLALVCENAMLYNGQDTVYYKAAVRLREHAVSVFEDARRQIAACEAEHAALLGADGTGLAAALPLFPPALLAHLHAPAMAQAGASNAVAESSGSSGSDDPDSNASDDSDDSASSDDGEEEATEEAGIIVGTPKAAPVSAPHPDSKLTSRARLPAPDPSYGLWDVVWAKSRGFPWYPALLVDVELFLSDDVDTDRFERLPSLEVMRMREKQPEGSALIMFFDPKRTWQWVAMDRVLPLGPPEVDDARLREVAKKPAIRKAIVQAHALALEYAASAERELHLAESERFRGISARSAHPTPSRPRRGAGGAGLGKGKMPSSHHGTPARGTVASQPGAVVAKGAAAKGAAGDGTAVLGVALRTISEEMVRVASAVAAKNTRKRARAPVAATNGDAKAMVDDGAAEEEDGADDGDGEGGEGEDEGEESLPPAKRGRRVGMCGRDAQCRKEDGHIGRCLTKDTRGMLRMRRKAAGRQRR